MKRNFTLIIAVLLLAFTLSACNPQPSATELTGAERDKATGYIEPIADNLLNGLVEGNYTAFSRDFNDKMRSAMDQKQFDGLKKQLDDKIGAYQSRSVDKVLDYGTMVTVAYQGVFSKAPKVQILLTVTKDEPHKVTGLYFK